MLQGGGCLGNEHPFEFSLDGKLILCCSGNSVRVISTVNGQQVCLLSGHTREVTSVSVINLGVDDSLLRAWTSSLDGTLKLWDFESGKCLRTLNIEFPIFSMVIPASRFRLSDIERSKSLSFEAYLSLEMENGGVVIVVNLTNGISLEGTLCETSSPKKLFLSPKGAFVGFCIQNYIVFWQTEKTSEYKKRRKKCKDIKIYHLLWESAVTAMAFSSNECHVAVGDKFGKIGIWYDFRSMVKIESQKDNSQEKRKLELNQWSDFHDLGSEFSQRSVALDLVRTKPETNANGSEKVEKMDDRGEEGSENDDDDDDDDENETNNIQMTEKAKEKVKFVKNKHHKKDFKNCSTLHWHASTVNAICFSRDDVYLYSGGNEAVMVIWQLHTGSKNFLPKLLSPITSFLPHPSDSLLLSVSFQNSCIRIINMSTLKIAKTIRGICPLPEMYGKRRKSDWNFDDSDLFCPVLAELDPLEGYLILPSVHSSVQFYDAKLDADVANFQVIPRNFILRTNDTHVEDEVFEFPFTVTHVAISCDGKSIVTVESKLPEGNIGQVFALKFWERAKTNFANEPFSMNTCIENAHQQTITSLTYHPKEDMVVTTGMDCVFKVWVKLIGKSRKTTKNDESDLPFCWRCRSAGDYRNRPFSFSSFSEDGSLLAVAACDTVSIFNPHTNGLICVIPNSVKNQTISRVMFIHQSTFLVTTTNYPMSVLSVIDVLTLGVSWSIRLDVKSMAVDSCSSQFAIIATFRSDALDAMISNSGNDVIMNGNYYGGREGGRRGEGEEEAYVIVFDARNPLPLCSWRLRDHDRATLMFSPPGLIGKRTKNDIDDVMKTDDEDGGEDEDEDEDVLYEVGSDLVIITRDRRYIVLNPMREIAILEKEGREGVHGGEDVKRMAMVDPSMTKKVEEGLEEMKIETEKKKSNIVVDIVDKKLLNYEATYGKLPTEEDMKKKMKKDIHGIQSLKPWGDILNGSSHVLPPLVRIYPSFMDSMLQKITYDGDGDDDVN